MTDNEGNSEMRETLEMAVLTSGKAMVSEHILFEMFPSAQFGQAAKLLKWLAINNFSIEHLAKDRLFLLSTDKW